MNCKLSLILPVYNVEKYLEECIHSIEKQSYQDYEVILVDDGSTDHSPQICDACAARDKRVRVIHSVNKGVSHARNLGMEVAKGEYFQFIDADDLLADNNVLQDMMQHISDSEVDLVSAKFINFQGEVPVNNTNTNSIRFEDTTSGERVREFIADTMLMINIFSKESLRGLQFDSRTALGEDILFLAKAISRVRKAVLLDKVCYYRRVRSDSAFHTEYKEGDLEQVLLVLDLLYQELHGKPAGDELYEKYYVDQTGLINKLVNVHRHYGREKRIIQKRLFQKFPHFLTNKLIAANTKLFLTIYMISPDVFYFFFKHYKEIKRMRALRKSNVKTESD